MAIDNKDKKVLNVPPLRFPEFSGEWKKCTIGELAIKVGSGVTPRGGESVYKMDGHPFVRSQNVGLGHLILDDIAFIDEETHLRQKSTELKLEDVLLNITGASIGRSALVNEQVVGGNVNQHVCIIRTKESLIPSFLCNFLLSNYGQRQIDSFQAGGNRQGLNFEQIKSIKIAIPSTKEQTKVAKLLQLIEERIATQNKIIEDLKKLKSAISKHLFARKDLLETTICLSNIATLKNGYAFQSGKYNALGKWKILTITNVPGERYINDEDCNCIINLPNDIQDHQVLKEGDILISLTGNVGRVSLCKNGNYLLNQRVGLLQLAKNVNQEFLYQILSSQRFENSMIACGQGAAQMNIGKGDVENYVLPYSSNGNNILFAAKILHSYDECIINELRRLTLLTMQKQYLLTQMFI